MREPSPWLHCFLLTDAYSIGGIDRRERFAQGIFLHLAHSVSRQLVNQQNPLRYFVASQPGSNRLEDPAFGQIGAGLGYDSGRDALA